MSAGRDDRGGPRAEVSTRLDLEYDGSGFAGWACQSGRRTVQGELEQALERLRGEPTPLTVAGRTDRGVHASGQVASHAGAPVPARALNAVLGPDVAVLLSARAADGFDARRDAIGRSYRYRVLARAERSALLAGRVLWWPRQVDREALDACAALVAGRHDFTAFTPAGGYHVHFERTVAQARWVRDADLLTFEISADAFMRQMNRVLVGTMLEVAGGALAVEHFASLLEGRPRNEAGQTAPAHGLELTSVRYPL